MARTLHFNKPTHTELRQLLHWLETVSDPIVRKRIDVTLALCAITVASEVAEIFDLHLNTVLHYARCFNRRRLRWIASRRRGGPRRKIPKRVERQIASLVQRPPTALGLPYGTWSLARLQWFVTKKRRLLRSISREHLRRILKKRGSICGVSSTRSIPQTRGAERFWLVFLGPSSTSHRGPWFCSWM